MIPKELIESVQRNRGDIKQVLSFLYAYCVDKGKDQDKSGIFVETLLKTGLSHMYLDIAMDIYVKENNCTFLYGRDGKFIKMI